MSEIRNGAETLTETAAEIRGELPYYRELANLITGAVIATCIIVAIAAIAVTVKHAA